MKAFVKPARVETASAFPYVVRTEPKQAGTVVNDSRCTVVVKQSIPVNRYQNFAKTTDVQGLIYRTSVLRPSGNKEFQMISSSDLVAFKDSINMESSVDKSQIWAIKCSKMQVEVIRTKFEVAPIVENFHTTKDAVIMLAQPIATARERVTRLRKLQRRCVWLALTWRLRHWLRHSGQKNCSSPLRMCKWNPIVTCQPTSRAKSWSDHSWTAKWNRLSIEWIQNSDSIRFFCDTIVDPGFKTVI